ncbi:MAG: hypothetical protein MR727_07865 [Lentisphaeria bacterium]|nr:hypothetical protein [Lentisphaeria bacterium]
MKNKKKNGNSMETLKRQFMRMQSPSAFGAVRRFDSASFMNVPPEMARRDAAYDQLSSLFLSRSFDSMSTAERRELYSRIIDRLTMTVEKTEFIQSADILEKRHLEGAELLMFLRLVLKYFASLDAMAESQSAAEDFPALKKLLNTVLDNTFVSLNSTFHSSEAELFEAVQNALRSAQPLLDASREKRRKQFSKSDSERYERSYAAFTDYYADPQNP